MSWLADYVEMLSATSVGEQGLVFYPQRAEAVLLPTREQVLIFYTFREQNFLLTARYQVLGGFYLQRAGAGLLHAAEKGCWFATCQRAGDLLPSESIHWFALLESREQVLVSTSESRSWFVSCHRTGAGLLPVREQVPVFHLLVKREGVI
jgi:hypothetical protein